MINYPGYIESSIDEATHLTFEKLDGEVLEIIHDKRIGSYVFLPSTYITYDRPALVELLEKITDVTFLKKEECKDTTIKNSTSKLRLYRFTLSKSDSRPTFFPPPHPYWWTGYDYSDRAIILAYGESDEYIKKYWPDAILPLEYKEVDEYLFTSRFPKPYWLE